MDHFFLQVTLDPFPGAVKLQELMIFFCLNNSQKVALMIILVLLNVATLSSKQELQLQKQKAIYDDVFSGDGRLLASTLPLPSFPVHVSRVAAQKYTCIAVDQHALLCNHSGSL